ncbi:asparagine synthase-related protein [Butyrivibrio sp. WCE2006]|uniref:asparagine synthase-related protein n=1 Tax=Butyrivibrio sp. WCE2006 TaxID=1410611 RepID=UPI0005D2C5EC|nr:asparagine synthase-related protein [Butyrivibrio sp. WCE2006]
MSAIWGHIDFDEQNCSIESMVSEYKRKCKLDRISEMPYKNALFGCGLQYITRECPNEELPYLIDENTILTTDCYLFNRDELIKDLSLSDDTPDGKVVCKAYSKWGYELVNHLSGLFSIAIYNFDKRELFICSDQMANRSIYYYRSNGKCTFSTLISPILQVYGDIAVNETYLKDFLIAPGLLPVISDNETPWEGLYIIPSGTYVIIKENTFDTVRYYKPIGHKKIKSIKQAKNEFLEIYDRVVRQCIRTDGKVSIALSGGFDSSSVAAFAAKNLDKEGKQLFSYTYVPYYKDVQKEMPRNYISDETDVVKKTAQMYPNIVTSFEDDSGETFIDSVDHFLDILEIPYKAYVSLPTITRIFKKAKESGSKIFLTGQYGNVTVSFGDVYFAMIHLYKNKHFLKCLEYYNNYYKAIRLSRKSNLKVAFKYIRDCCKNNTSNTDFSDVELNRFVNKDILKEYNVADRFKKSNFLTVNSKSFTVEDYYRFISVSNSYSGVVDTKIGLYTGLLQIDPTRHPDIIEYCMSIPYEYFAYNGIPRYMIRGFMKDMLPEDVLYPYEKYGAQEADWLRRLEGKIPEVIRIFEAMSTGVEIKHIKIDECISFLKKDNALIYQKNSNYTQLFIIFVYAKYIRKIARDT